MQNIVKAIWMIAVLMAGSGVAWFLFLLMNDKTNIGPAGPFILTFIWAPALIFVVVSTVLLIKNKVPAHPFNQTLLLLLLVGFSFIFSLTLLREPHYERVMQEVEAKNRQFLEDSKQFTSDKKYEYFFHLVGRLTDSPRAHISIRNLSNHTEKNIKIDLNYEGIGAVEKLPPSVRMVEVSATDKEHIYKLTTTPQLKDEIEVFEVNMQTGLSRKIE